MFLSKEVRYGTRAMIEIAMAYSNGSISATEIARRQELSLKFLEQILRALKAAGLLKATRGIQGGYALARPPEAILLSDIFKAIEGSPCLTECIEQPQSCSRVETCPTRDIWIEMTEKLAGVLETTTLRSLVESGQKKAQARAPIYEI